MCRKLFMKTVICHMPKITKFFVLFARFQEPLSKCLNAAVVFQYKQNQKLENAMFKQTV